MVHKKNEKASFINTKGNKGDKAFADFFSLVTMKQLEKGVPSAVPTTYR